MLCGKDVAHIEGYDNYTKQTYRNRCMIADANGPLALTIPTEKTGEGKCLMRDIRISDHGNWRHQHWNALEAAYRHTPFFQYYEDDFRPFSLSLSPRLQRVTNHSTSATSAVTARVGTPQRVYTPTHRLCLQRQPKRAH